MRHKTGTSSYGVRNVLTESVSEWREIKPALTELLESIRTERLEVEADDRLEHRQQAVWEQRELYLQAQNSGADRVFFPSSTAYLKLPSVRPLWKEDHDESLYGEALDDLMRKRWSRARNNIRKEITDYSTSLFTNLVKKVVSALRNAYLRSQDAARNVVNSDPPFASGSKRSFEQNLNLLSKLGVQLTCQACKSTGTYPSFCGV